MDGIQQTYLSIQDGAVVYIIEEPGYVRQEQVTTVETIQEPVTPALLSSSNIETVALAFTQTNESAVQQEAEVVAAQAEESTPGYIAPVDSIAEGAKKQFKCEQCGRAYETEQKLKTHLILHRRSKIHPCPYCDKKFTIPSKLKLHVLMHTGGGDHECLHCGKKFTMQCKLKEHMVSHSDAMPFRCESCSKRFKRLASLKDHINRIHPTTNGVQPPEFVCNICKKVFTRNDQLKLHMLRHSDERPYRCKICNRGFVENTKLRRHMEVHSNISHPCLDCTRQFRSRRSLRRHQADCHVLGQFPCPHCSTNFTTQNALNKHVIQAHTDKSLKRRPPMQSNKPHRCLQCIEAFSDEASLRHHENIHSINRPHLCAKCGESFVQAKNLKKHMLNHIDSSQHLCMNCGDMFATQRELVEHVKSHVVPSYPCEICQVVLSSDQALLAHMKIHGTPDLAIKTVQNRKQLKVIRVQMQSSRKTTELTKENLQPAVLKVQSEGCNSKSKVDSTAYSCYYCYTNFDNDKDLKIHLATHPLEYAYGCDKCSRFFKSAEALEKHSVHHTSRAHPCPHCMKGFPFKSLLNNHIAKSHKVEGVYNCKRCSQRFTSVEHLRKHVSSTHTASRPFVCPICKASFKVRDNLKRHMLIHPDTLPYVCKRCYKAYRTTKELAEHKIIHAGEPYVCPICGKRVMYLYDFKFHMTKHTGEKPYKCSICSKGFRRSDKCKEHMHRVHVKPNEKGKASYVRFGSLNVGLTKSDHYNKVHARLDCPITGSTSGKLSDQPPARALDGASGHFQNATEAVQENAVKEQDSESIPTQSIPKVIEEIIRKNQSVLDSVDIVPGASLSSQPIEETNTEKNACQLSIAPIPSKCNQKQPKWNGKVTTCPYCLKPFANRSNFNRHVTMHTNQKPHTCRFCGHGFCDRSSLRIHMHKHTGRKPYCCEVCGSTFTTNYSLKQHRTMHSEARPFECPECNQKYRTKYMLKRHSRIHSGERPYICSECGAAFAQSSALNYHMTKHIRTQQFKCAACIKVFRTLNALQSHQQEKHGLNRWDTCPDCGEEIQNTADALKHMEKHKLEEQEKQEHSTKQTEQVLYECAECLQHFNTIVDFKNHFAKSHMDKELQSVNVQEQPGEQEGSTDVEILENPSQSQEAQQEESQFYVCGECGFGCYSVAQLKVHYKDQHLETFQVLDQPLPPQTEDHITDNQQRQQTNSVSAMASTQKVVLFKCIVCSVQFEDLAKMQVHFKEVHPQKLTQPKISHVSNGEEGPRIENLPKEDVGQKVTEEPADVKQMGKEKQSILFECMICYNKFESMAKMQLHYKTYHPGRLSQLKMVHFECLICRKRFESMVKMQYHMKASHVNKSQCSSAVKDVSKERLPNLQDSKPDSKEKCDIVKSAEDKQGWKKAVLFECIICKERFESMANMQSHYRGSHPDKVRKPGQLPKLTSNLVLKSLAYECYICKQKYDTVAAMQRHQRTDHTNPTKLQASYICLICKEVFTNMPKLQAHFMTQHPEKLSREQPSRESPVPSQNNMIRLEPPPQIILDMSVVEPRSPIAEDYPTFDTFEKLVQKPNLTSVDVEIPGMDIESPCVGVVTPGATNADKKGNSANDREPETKGLQQQPVVNPAEIAATEEIDVDSTGDSGHFSRQSQETYKCPKCCESFTDLALAQQHMQSHIYTCEVCGKPFESGMALDNHRTMHLKEKPQVCFHCSKGFRNHTLLIEHLQNEKVEKPEVCVTCTEKFWLKMDLQEHQKSHVTMHSCHRCAEEFTSVTQLKYHMNSKHKLEKHICSECRRVYESAEQLEFHVKRQHIVKTNLTCAECNCSYAKREEYEAHRSVHSNQMVSHFCVDCKELLPSTESLRAHLISKHPKSSGGTRKCVKGFGQIDLNSPPKAHSQDHVSLEAVCKPSSLEDSRKSELAPNTKQEALEATTDLLSYSKESAEQSPNDKRLGKSYAFMMTSSGAQDILHRCSFCSYQFLFEADLEKHKLTHGSDPLKCGLCEETFDSKGSLDKHYKVTHEHIDIEESIIGEKNDKIWNVIQEFHNYSKVESCSSASTYQQKENSDFHKILTSRKISKPTLLLNISAPSTLASTSGPSPVAHRVSLPEATTLNSRERASARRKEKKHLHALAARPRQMPTSMPKSYNCPLCPETFENKSKLRSHRTTVHPDHNALSTTKVTCEVCALVSSSIYQHNIHMRVHTGEKPFSCQYCEKPFRTKSALRVHLKIHTGERPFGCRYCGKRFHGSSAVKVHERIHTGVRPYKCHHCPAAFYENSRLTRHSSIHSNKKPVKCSECGAAFRNNALLLSHCRSRHPKGTFSCSECERTFAMPSLLRQHMIQMHSTQELYLCAECGKVSHSRQALISHIKAQHRNKVSSVTSGTSHVKTKKEPNNSVTDAFDAKCKKCGENFTKPQQYDLHIKSHMYPCTYCEKMCRTQPGLRKHIMEHHTSKSHFCPVCSKSFSKNQSLVIHMKTHGEKKYFCQECGEGFAFAFALGKHRKKFHPDSIFTAAADAEQNQKIVTAAATSSDLGSEMPEVVTVNLPVAQQVFVQTYDAEPQTEMVMIEGHDFQEQIDSQVQQTYQQWQ